MAMQEADLLTVIKDMQKRIDRLERGSRYGVTYDADDFSTRVFRIRTDEPGIGFWATVPVGRQPHPATLEDVINVLAAYGLTF